VPRHLPITWLPYYLVRERLFSMDRMAKIGGTAYLVGACFATLSGWISDREKIPHDGS